VMLAAAAAKTYFGFEKDQWDLIFSSISTLAVIIAAPLGWRAIRESMHQKMNDSLTTLLTEYRSESFRNSVRNVMVKFPVFEGSYTERVALFVDYAFENLKIEDLEDARSVVHRLNDLGAYVDQGGVRESDFYGQTFPRLIEMCARLEPLILAVSAQGSFRWGMRIRRLRVGASAYVKSSRAHSTRDVKVDGKVIVPSGRSPLLLRTKQKFKSHLGKRTFTPSLRSMLSDDERALKEARVALDSIDPIRTAFLTKAA
jgi:hypothetical protein